MLFESWTYILKCILKGKRNNSHGVHHIVKYVCLDTQRKMLQSKFRELRETKHRYKVDIKLIKRFFYRYFIPTPIRVSVRCIPKYDCVEMYSWKRKSRYLWHYTISLGNSWDDKKLGSRDLIVWYTDMCPIPAVRSRLYDVWDALHKYLLRCFLSWQR